MHGFLFYFLLLDTAQTLFVLDKKVETVTFHLSCEIEVPCSFFSVRDESNLCSQPHNFLSCMGELRQHLSRGTPLSVLETKRHFFLFCGNSLRQLRSKKLQYVSNSCFFGDFFRVKLTLAVTKYMLFTGREVRIGKNCARGLEYGRTGDRGHSFSQYGPTKAGE